jgi:acetylornithine deacetylase/succinyl-diaminopimelate desuccinylase-like protein
MKHLDWDKAGDEMIRHMQELIRFDTTNPPGNEIDCCRYIAETLCGAGYEPVVLECAPDRGNIVTRLRGTGEKPPLLIYGHVDVVPAEPESWQHPPFSGDIADGCIWGRGALDMKYLVAYELETMLLLAREQGSLKRDVIFAATADEEAGGDMGAGWLVENHPELIQAEYGLSEGAGSTMWIDGRPFYGIRVAEKGAGRFSLVAHGAPGHGSIPRQDTSVHLLAKAVSRIYETPLPLHMTATTDRYVRNLAGALGIEVGEQIGEADVAAVADALPTDVALSLQAVVRNTAVPTGLTAGSKINVVPGVARAAVDGRVVPGQTPEELYSEVRKVVGDGFDIEPGDRGVTLEEAPGNELHQTIERVVQRHDPEAVVLPTMLSGATDARWVSKMGTKCLGFGPIRFEPGFPGDSLVHSHNERAPVDGLVWGARVFYEVVREFAQ